MGPVVPNTSISAAWIARFPAPSAERRVPSMSNRTSRRISLLPRWFGFPCSSDANGPGACSPRPSAGPGGFPGWFSVTSARSAGNSVRFASRRARRAERERLRVPGVAEGPLPLSRAQVADGGDGVVEHHRVFAHFAGGGQAAELGAVGGAHGALRVAVEHERGGAAQLGAE